MKLILSRKGFDSSNGHMPSPIMPDGTLLSMPIPDDVSYHTYSTLKWNSVSYFDVIKSLKPRTTLTEECHCHLDPDIREEASERPNGWQPAFGQIRAALTELRNNGVKEDDIFLFFGWFKQTELINNKLRFVRKAPDLHVIYGYLQIGAIIDKKDEVPQTLIQHPHYINHDESWNKGMNAIFVPSQELSLAPEIPGYGVLDYRIDRVLTKNGYTRGRWDLPDFFRDVKISHNPNPWKNGYFQSAGIGQEFIMDATPDIQEWIKKRIL